MKLNELADVQGRPTIWVRPVDKFKVKGDPDDMQGDVNYEVYEVYYRHTKIGEVTWGDYFGDIVGTIGRRGVKIERGTRSIQDAISSYFATPTGQKHLAVLLRQLNIS